MARKYGDDFFTEGSARLAQTRAEKQQKLLEIEQQLAETNTSVRQGKQLRARWQKTMATWRRLRTSTRTRRQAAAADAAAERGHLSPGSPARIPHHQPKVRAEAFFSFFI